MADGAVGGIGAGVVADDMAAGEEGGRFVVGEGFHAAGALVVLVFVVEKMVDVEALVCEFF